MERDVMAADILRILLLLRRGRLHQRRGVAVLAVSAGSLLGLLLGHHRCKDGLPFRSESRTDCIRGINLLAEEGLHMPLSLELNLPTESSLNVAGQFPVSILPKLQLTHLALLHHSRCRVDGVAEKAVAWQPLADDARNDGARVQAHLEAHAVGLELQDLVCRHNKAPKALRVALSLVHVLRHDADTGNILLPDRLDLRHLIRLAYLVKLCEVLVQERQDPCWREPISYLIEVVNEDKEDGHSLHVLCNDLSRPSYHRQDHVLWHHVLQNRK
mmetsp:Transcript_118085/g.345875  ORF Transcript_118085/g.345875 Transcript_118085/m.345875 type:complete len:272 (-) Transcript_118085:229-1044(-)